MVIKMKVNIYSQGEGVFFIPREITIKKRAPLSNRKKEGDRYGKSKNSKNNKSKT